MNNSTSIVDLGLKKPPERGTSESLRRESAADNDSIDEKISQKCKQVCEFKQLVGSSGNKSQQSLNTSWKSQLIRDASIKQQNESIEDTNSIMMSPSIGSPDGQSSPARLSPLWFSPPRLSLTKTHARIKQLQENMVILEER